MEGRIQNIIPAQTNRQDTLSNQNPITCVWVTDWSKGIMRSLTKSAPKKLQKVSPELTAKQEANESQGSRNANTHQLYISDGSYNNWDCPEIQNTIHTIHSDFLKLNIVNIAVVYCSLIWLTIVLILTKDISAIPVLIF